MEGPAKGKAQRKNQTNARFVTHFRISKFSNFQILFGLKNSFLIVLLPLKILKN